MKKQQKFVLIIAAIVVTLAWMAVGGVRESATYYVTLDELLAMENPGTKRIRVGGDVADGSIVRHASSVEFRLHQQDENMADPTILEVVYTGVDPLPDTFRDKAQALCDGYLRSDGKFEATKIQAKCASKYEAEPADDAAPVYGAKAESPAD
ncbi:MAG: cytochrome c maturation protein CcmE [Bryobacterales bacterium]|nr:cytochrome c maturation protein CcmE [Bryobacterales bacterium]MDE0264183.1 cytochrome c maturation protein CcmE [Bryobacterales bacterium]MDE0624055.1 cytochrome c maturation protein CcmE [Bryobacterales bacterium]